MADYFVYIEMGTTTGLRLRELVAKDLDELQVKEVHKQAIEKCDEQPYTNFSRCAYIGKASEKEDSKILKEFDYYNVTLKSAQ